MKERQEQIKLRNIIIPLIDKFCYEFVIVFLLEIKLKIKYNKKIKIFLNFLLIKYVKNVNMTIADKERTLATEQRKDKKQP